MKQIKYLVTQEQYGNGTHVNALKSPVEVTISSECNIHQKIIVIVHTHPDNYGDKNIFLHKNIND